MAVESQFYSENLGFQIPTVIQDRSFQTFSPVDNLNLSAVVEPQQTHFHVHPASFQNLGVDRNRRASSSTSVTFSSMALNSELELQKQEMDFLLQLQNEKLRIALHEQRKQQVMALLSNLETEASKLMRQKEAELAQATRKARELEERLKKAEVENEAWKRMANTKEAMVMGLHSQLEEARERQYLVSTGAEDAESHCPSEEDSDSDSEKEAEEGGRSRSGMACKSCKNRNPCVLFLPCRHLCSCKYCEAFLGCCPVCNSVKEASMEVLLV